MNNPIITAIAISVIFGFILVLINVYNALKHPERYQKTTDEIYKQINETKESISKTISWEEAKKQAAIELELEATRKQERKAMRQKEKDKKRKGK